MDYKSDFVYKDKLWLELVDVREILNNVNFAEYSCIDMDWNFEVMNLDGFYMIRTSFKRKDIVSGEFGTGWGRWHTTPVAGATETSVIMTAWVAVKMIVEHELLESFEYKGKKIFNPHKSLEELIYPETLPNG